MKDQIESIFKENLAQVDRILNAVRQYNELAVDLFSQTVTSGMKSFTKEPCSCKPSGTSMRHGVVSDSGIICPPQDCCPPRCLLTITRHANLREVINIPFKVRNRSNFMKTFKLGVRPFLDADGNVFYQPSLDKTTINVPAGAATEAEMQIDTANGFIPGSAYETEIVILENHYNQNICIKLIIDPAKDIPEAVPCDEKDLDTHFHHWYYHYYCEKENVNLIPKGEIITEELKKARIAAKK